MHNFTHMQKEILRAIEIQGGITQTFAAKNGWVNKFGIPNKEFNVLIHDLRIVAPRVLTSVPLRVVWQMRVKRNDNETLAKIEREASKLNFKEYAPGGFKL